MTEAPETIVAWPVNQGRRASITTIGGPPEKTVKYVRADLLEALEAQNTRLRDSISYDGYLIERLRVSADHMDRSNSEMVHKAADALAAAQEENAKLRDALHDAINRPKGVVPKSAEPFYDQTRAALGKEG